MRRYIKELIKAGLIMFKSVFISGLIMLITCCSCKSQGKVKNKPNEKMVLETVLRGNYSGQEKENISKIDNQSELEAFFGKINRTRKPGLPIPNINFDNKTLVVWQVGKTTSINTELQLGSISEKTIYLKKTKAKKKLSNTAILSPFVIYGIPKTTKNIKIQ